MNKQITSLLSTTVLALSLTACGDSAEVSQLREMLDKAEAGVQKCEGKKGADLTSCTTPVLDELSSNWNGTVQTAASDDPEAVSELTTRYTVLSSKISSMMNAAFN